MRCMNKVMVKSANLKALEYNLQTTKFLAIKRVKLNSKIMLQIVSFNTGMDSLLWLT